MLAVTRLLLTLNWVVTEGSILTFDVSTDLFLRHFLPPVVLDGVPCTVVDSTSTFTVIILALHTFVSALIALLNIYS